MIVDEKLSFPTRLKSSVRTAQDLKEVGAGIQLRRLLARGSAWLSGDKAAVAIPGGRGGVDGAEDDGGMDDDKLGKTLNLRPFFPAAKGRGGPPKPPGGAAGSPGAGSP